MREPYKVGSDGGIFFIRFASALFFVAAVMVLLFGSGDFIGSLDKFFDLAVREFDYSDVWQIPDDMQIWIDGVIVGRYRHYFIFTLSAILMLVLSLVQFILPYFIGKNRLAYRKYWVIQMVLCVITFMCSGLFVCSGIIVCVIRNVSNSMLFGIIPLVLTFIGVILEGCAVAALLHNYDFEGKKAEYPVLNGFKAGCGKGMRFVWLASVPFIAAALMALLCNTFFPDLFGYSLYQLDSPPETVYDIDPSLIWSIVQVDGNTVWVYRIDFIQTYWPTFIMMMMSFILLAASAVQFVLLFFAGKGKFSRRRYWMVQVVLFILVLMCGSIHICMAIIAGVTNGMAKFWWYGIIPIILILAGIALECCGFGTLLKGYEYEDEGV